MTDEDFMRAAILVAQVNSRYPFGAVIVDTDQRQILSEGVNNASQHPLWHGEIVAINHCVALRPDWQQLTLYTTAEPCPMCMSAILWCGMGRVVFGTSITTLSSTGWNQIRYSARSIIEASHRPQTSITQGVLESECDKLFHDAVNPPQ